MRLRIFVITALLVGGFLFLTTKADWGQRRILDPVAGSGPLWSGPSLTHATSLSSDENNNIDIYKAAHIATVNITSTVYRRSIFWEVYPSKDQGSGFLISPDGKILTNSHVVANERQLEVTLPDQSHYKARLLSRDESNDVALLQIEPRTKLPSLHLGDSDGLQVGQRVLAIGNPFGFQSTLTTGVVSALGRTVQTGQSTVIDGAIQTDAAINQGNSGGPLLNSHGEVIGINSAIYTPSGTTAGIGFAIPISTARQIAQDLITEGRVHRASMGVEARLLTPAVAEALHLPVTEGLMIERVTPGGPAASAGLRGGDHQAILGMRRIVLGGDVVTGIDGRPITGQMDLNLALNRKRPGDVVKVEYYRGGQKMEAQVTLNDSNR